MVQIKNPITVGGGVTEIVNGVIEQHRAKSGTIPAGTFVEMEGFASDNFTKTQDISFSTPGFNYITAVDGFDNLVFATSTSASASTNYLIDFSNGTPQVVATDSTTLVSDTDQSVIVSITSPIPGYVIVVTSPDGTATRPKSNFSVRAIKIEESSGTYNISVGSAVSHTVANSYVFSTVRVAGQDSSHFILAYDSHTNGTYNSQDYYAMVITLSSTSVSLGTKLQIERPGWGTSILCTKLSDNACVIRYSSQSSSIDGAAWVILARSGTTLTKKTAVAESSLNISGSPLTAYLYNAVTSIILDTNRIAIAWLVNNGVAIRTLTISNNLVSATDISDSTTQYFDQGGQISLFGTDIITVGFKATGSSPSPSLPTLAVFRIVNGEPNLAEEFAVEPTSGDITSLYYFWSLRLSQGIRWIEGGTSGSTKYTQLLEQGESEIIVFPATNPDGIQGLTATDCTDQAVGDVWALNTNETNNN